MSGGQRRIMTGARAALRMLRLLGLALLLSSGAAVAEEPLEGYIHGVDLGIPAHQGGWPCAGSWVVGVLDRIHGGSPRSLQLSTSL